MVSSGIIRHVTHITQTHAAGGARIHFHAGGTGRVRGGFIVFAGWYGDERPHTHTLTQELFTQARVTQTLKHTRTAMIRIERACEGTLVRQGGVCGESSVDRRETGKRLFLSSDAQVCVVVVCGNGFSVFELPLHTHTRARGKVSSRGVGRG